MKKISIYLVSFMAAMLLISCGDDEPEITRVQDGNGKVFLETGTLVDANLNFSEAELEEALKTYQWEREYSFYYDNYTVSNRYEIKGLPIFMHPDGTIEYDDASSAKYTATDKFILVSNEVQVGVNNYSYYDMLKVVSLDLTEDAGRMVIDRIVPMGYGKSDYSNTTYTRMVWKAVMQ